MVLSIARARGQFEAGKKTEAVRVALVLGDAEVALVVIAERPHALGAGRISRSSEVAHCPKARPESADISPSRQGDARFQMASFEAHLIP